MRRGFWRGGVGWGEGVGGKHCGSVKSSAHVELCEGVGDVAVLTDLRGYELGEQMSQAFIIMQIGNPELDRVYEQAIVPALTTCDLDPKRVDKHTQGNLLKSEIVAFIEDSDIIIADLTNERPNCYLEVGYAMGVDKFRNLILTAREDHNQGSPNHRPGGPRVHFDLSGYSILFWDPNHIDDFRAELVKRIRRRQAILAPPAPGPESPWDEEWLEQHRTVASAGLKNLGKSGWMEVRFALSNSKPHRTQRELYDAAEKAQIHTFGWPIGVVLTGSEQRPRSRVDGIVAEIAQEDRSSYDYWAFRRNGDFYLFKSLFEDERRPGSIFFNTRIVRTTETLLYCVRLYTRLGVHDTAVVNVGIRHGGLQDRVLTASASWRSLYEKFSTTEAEVYSEVQASLTGIESRLVEFVKDLTQPLFMIFDFFELSDQVYADIVNKFVEGKVT